jgi:hypothetical protein
MVDRPNLAGLVIGEMSQRRPHPVRCEIEESTRLEGENLCLRVKQVDGKRLRLEIAQDNL